MNFQEFSKNCSWHDNGKCNGVHDGDEDYAKCVERLCARYVLRKTKQSQPIPLDAIQAARDSHRRFITQLKIETPCPVAAVNTATASIKAREQFISELEQQLAAIDAWLEEVER